MSDLEIWRPIDGFHGSHEISNLGRVKSLPRFKVKRERIIKQFLNGRGYYKVSLYNNSGKHHSATVHRLIAKAFIPKIDGKYFINHKNGIKTDNKISNLEWCTQSENMLHSMHVLGKKSNTGTNHWGNKLSPEQVRQIRERYAIGNESAREISIDYGIRSGHVAQIVTGKCWRHIYMPPDLIKRIRASSLSRIKR